MKTTEPKMKPFRTVLVRCSECKCEQECRMQVDDGEYEWDCDGCHDRTTHVVTAATEEEA